MAIKVNLATLTRTYRDSTNETTSTSFSAVVPALDGTNYQQIRTELSDVLDAMELFQSVNVQPVSEAFTVTSYDPNGTDIPSDSAVQREAVVKFYMNDGTGSTFLRTIGCVNHANVTLAGSGSDEISPASAEWQALNAAVTGGTLLRSPYGQGGISLQRATVGGRNN